MMRAMPLLNSMATTGRVACWRSVKTDLQELQAVATVVVGATEAEWVLVEASGEEAVLVAVAPLGVASVDVEVLAAVAPTAVPLRAMILLPFPRV